MANRSGDNSFEANDSSASFLPESDYVSQGLDRFPLLVWKKILENLNCWSWDYLEILKLFAAVKLPGDFLSNPELDSIRKNVSFNVLLPILTSNYVGTGYIFVDHASLLDFQDIHNCRLVCRAWNFAIRKNVVEHVSRSHHYCCLHEWESNFLWPRENRNPYANNCNNAYSVATTSRVTKFLSHFRQSHKCQGDVSPFHCHHFNFELTSHNDSQFMDDSTVASAAAFFAQYGKHLRRVNFNLFCREANSVGGLYPNVFDLLRESLNLVALRISWKCLFSNGIEAFLKNGAKAGGCPELKWLTHLEVDGLPHLIFNNIIRSNGGHIEKLKISGLGGRNCAMFRKYALNQIPLKNLCELRISFELATKEDIIRLSKSAPHWTKLKKLYLSFSRLGGDLNFISWVWTLILQCLNKFSNTVTHLWLGFPSLISHLSFGPIHDYCSTREDRLKLPNLEQVVFKFPQGCVFSLDLLLGLEKLQTLYIHELGVSLKIKTSDQLYKTFVRVREYQEREGPEKIEYPLSRDLQHSNIWEKLPKLSKLYWRQLDKKCAWKKEMKSLNRESSAELTAWALRDSVEEIPDFWKKWWADVTFILTMNSMNSMNDFDEIRDELL